MLAKSISLRLLLAAHLFVVAGSAGFAEEAEPEVTAGSMTFTPQGAGLGTSPVPVPRGEWAMPAMAWDGVEGASAWSASVMAALDGPGASLIDVVPDDIHAWCPAYTSAGPDQRAAFWAGLVSTLAYYESTHDPRAVGGEGRWYGLLQIVPATARGYQCEVGTGSDLLDGPANLRCGLRIMGVTVPRDNVIAAGMDGVAADWGPFHSRRKREAMRNWMLNQAYCVPSLRPEVRPDGLHVGAPGVVPSPRPI